MVEVVKAEEAVGSGDVFASAEEPKSWEVEVPSIEEGPGAGMTWTAPSTGIPKLFRNMRREEQLRMLLLQAAEGGRERGSE